MTRLTLKCNIYTLNRLQLSTLGFPGRNKVFFQIGGGLGRTYLATSTQRGALARAAMLVTQLFHIQEGILMPQIPFTRGSRLRELHLKVLSLFLVLSFTLVPYNTGATSYAKTNDATQSNKAIFFVSDGMRQDLAENYAAQGLLPTFGGMLKNGAKAADGGLLTQAPPTRALAGSAWLPAPGVAFMVPRITLSIRTGPLSALQPHSVPLVFFRPRLWPRRLNAVVKKLPKSNGQVDVAPSSTDRQSITGRSSRAAA